MQITYPDRFHPGVRRESRGQETALYAPPSPFSCCVRGPLTNQYRYQGRTSLRKCFTAAGQSSFRTQFLMIYSIWCIGRTSQRGFGVGHLESNWLLIDYPEWKILHFLTPNFPVDSHFLQHFLISIPPLSNYDACFVYALLDDSWGSWSVVPLSRGCHRDLWDCRRHYILFFDAFLQTINLTS